MSQKQLFWLIVILILCIVAPNTMAGVAASIIHAFQVFGQHLNLH